MKRASGSGLYPGMLDFISDAMSDVVDSDIYSGGRKALDVLGIGEAISIASGSTGMVPGAGFTPGADKLLGPLGYITSGIDLFSGGYNLAEGIDQGDPTDVVDGVHDIVGGTSGMLGNVPGPVGACAKAFSGGYAVGDMIAPYVFGSEEDSKGTHYEEIPEDGVFKPSTGNQYVDGALDLFGIRD